MDYSANRYNYHTHTYRCHHAVGTEEEYVLEAIEKGVKKMGFSDHNPYPDLDGFSGHRMQSSETKGYVDTILALREKYKKQIDIYIGFEAEYYPLYFDSFLHHIQAFPYDYLILGQHFLGNETDHDTAYCYPPDDKRLLKKYVDQVCEAMDTGAFSYVAHPDCFAFLGSNEEYVKEMKRLCEHAKKCNVPLEINGLGIRTHRHYPNDLFWQVAGKVGVSVVYGCDAHDPQNAWDQASFEETMRTVKRFQLHFLDEVPLHRAP